MTMSSHHDMVGSSCGAGYYLNTILGRPQGRHVGALENASFGSETLLK
jgi:hypothetical protein